MRVAIVNDMPMAMEGMRRVLQHSGRHEIAWMAWSGEEAVANCARDLPDIVLMDLIMPGLDGIGATRRIMQTTPCPILIVTASVDSNCSLVFQAMGEGALDAVNTPMLGVSGTGEGRDALLRKIDQIAVLKGCVSPRPARSAPPTLSSVCPGGDERLIVIGSSSGGPQALAACLQALPADFPFPIVIVQHVDAQFAPGLARWLDDQAVLSVRLARQGDRPTAGTVLIAGTNDHLVLGADGVLSYTPVPEESPYRPSVDVFWHSVSCHWHGPVTAVLLTGMGRDGAKGMLELRQAGARTIAQDEQTSTVYGMPKAARDIGAAQAVMPLDQIASTLCDHIRTTTGD